MSKRRGKKPSEFGFIIASCVDGNESIDMMEFWDPRALAVSGTRRAFDMASEHFQETSKAFHRFIRISDVPVFELTWVFYGSCGMLLTSHSETPDKTEASQLTLIYSRLSTVHERALTRNGTKMAEQVCPSWSSDVGKLAKGIEGPAVLNLASQQFCDFGRLDVIDLTVKAYSLAWRCRVLYDLEPIQ